MDGARLTVDLVGTTYVSSPDTSDFAVLPQGTTGLSISSVNRVSNTGAVLTLAFTGNIASNLELRVAVDSSAHTAGVALTTGAVTVTIAPRPGGVGNVSLTPGPGSLDVTWNEASDADGYVVQYRRSSVGGSWSEQSVSGGSTTRTTLGDLQGETGYDVRVYATSHFAADGQFSGIARATTLPAHAIVSATDPSPLTENNLNGARLTVDLLTERHPYRSFSQRWTATEFAGWFTLAPRDLTSPVSRSSPTYPG